ncbi:hypothetical protein [Paraburkholderia strydomiana]
MTVDPPSMSRDNMHLRELEPILAIVADALRQQFPDDFHKRCPYAAWGVRSLLSDAGIQAEIVGGDFVAFVISNDGIRAGMHGFAHSKDQCSHFWVEANGRLIDLGPHFLPNESSFDVAPMPAVAWDLSYPLPRFLRYRSQDRFDQKALMSRDPAINARCAAFVERCRGKARSTVVGSKFPTWIVTGPSSVEIAANRKTPWAIGAMQFARRSDPRDLPF